MGGMSTDENSFLKKKQLICSLLTLNLLKFEYQRELETLVVQTFNDKGSSCLQEVTNVKAFNLSSTFAKMKFKELDERENYPWIMLVNSIIPANLTFPCIIVFVNSYLVQS